MQRREEEGQESREEDASARCLRGQEEKEKAEAMNCKIEKVLLSLLLLLMMLMMMMVMGDKRSKRRTRRMKKEEGKREKRRQQVVWCLISLQLYRPLHHRDC